MDRKRRETAGTMRVLDHYQNLGLDDWNNERVFKLCGLLRCTVHELGVLAGIPSLQSVDTAVRINHWTRPVALHFALIENWYYAVLKHENRPPVMPLDDILGSRIPL